MNPLTAKERERFDFAVIANWIPPGERVLDLGCGVGVATRLLQRHGCTAIGVDHAVKRLSLARRDEPALAMVAGDAAQLPFAAESLDGILAECSLSLTGFAPAVLAECHRVLRPGAQLAITDVFARVSDAAGPAPLAGCLASHRGRNEIVARLIDAGFRIERWENHSALLKTFIARLIFASGSLDSLWGGAAPGDAAALSASLRRSRPGYFLLIVSKSAKEARR